MKTPLATWPLLALLLASATPSKADPGNPNIDMQGFLRVANEAAPYRETHRVSEEDFIRMSREPGTIILDARSAQKFALLHIEGAINLNFADIDLGSLKAKLPDKNQRILIYCNNNFKGNQRAFADKSAVASLNLSTYVTLYGYGYRNVYELAPFLNVHTTKLKLVGSDPAAEAAARSEETAPGIDLTNSPFGAKNLKPRSP